MPIDPIKSISPSLQLDFDMGKEEARQREQPKTKAAILEISEEAKNKAIAEIRKMAEETRSKAEANRPRTYTERLQDMGRLPKSGGGGGGGMGTGKMSRDITKNYKKGGKVSSASSRADGCCIKGKTKGRMV
jgi:hypothetical protein